MTAKDGSGTFKVLAGSDGSDAKGCLKDCLRKSAKDGLVVVLTYSAIQWAVDGKAPDLDKMLLFYGLYFALTVVLRAMDSDLDQLARVSAFQLGLKMFSALA